MKKVLAFDMGATSIRGILAYIEDGKFCTKEVMRMAHKIQKREGRLYWDWESLAGKIEETILENQDVSCIGIDTWGVDFGLIDKEGNLLQAPHCYRDEKFSEGREEAKALMEEFELFQNSGNQIMTINTVYQLLALKNLEAEVYEKADKLLMIPDLLFYPFDRRKDWRGKYLVHNRFIRFIEEGRFRPSIFQTSIKEGAGSQNCSSRRMEGKYQECKAGET